MKTSPLLAATLKGKAMKRITASEVAAPSGMSGIAVEPWAAGEIFAVAADWAQASCPVLVYGDDGWTHDECGRQVADSATSHQRPIRAMKTPNMQS